MFACDSGPSIAIPSGLLPTWNVIKRRPADGEGGPADCDRAVPAEAARGRPAAEWLEEDGGSYRCCVARWVREA